MQKLRIVIFRAMRRHVDAFRRFEKMRAGVLRKMLTGVLRKMRTGVLRKMRTSVLRKMRTGVLRKMRTGVSGNRVPTFRK